MSLKNINILDIKKDTKTFEKIVRQTIIALWLEIRTFNFNGRQLSVAYDTAWVGSIKDGQNKPVFPDAIEWLLKTQSPEGSWKTSSSTSSFICDQMLSTVTAIGTLASYEKFKSSPNVLKGLEWVSNNLPAINDRDPEFIKSVGFELLFPSQLLRLNRVLPVEVDISKYLTMQEDKLSKLPLNHIINARTPVLFSIEFLDSQVSKEKINLDYQLSNNGSLACSPASTAWYASKSPKSVPSLLYYLESTKQNDYGWPHFSDSKLFNLAYSLYIIQRSLGYIPEHLGPFVDQLYTNWTPLGIGFSSHFPVPDFDDTILALNVLSTTNSLKDSDYTRFWNVLNFYTEQDHFKSYPYEKDASVLVNLHTLDVIKDKPAAKDHVENLLTFFRTILQQNNFFGKDKYHYSAFLQNARGVIAFSNLDNSLAVKCLLWFYEMLGQDGSWTNYPHPTLEEIAYTVMALSYYSLYIEKLDLELLKPSVNYLMNHIFDSFEPVWVSKVLYAPYEIQKSNLFASLILYYQALGNTIDL